MSTRLVDEAAIRIPQMSGLAPCLCIPIGAKNLEAIERYVGGIERPLARGDPPNALLVKTHDPPDLDLRLPIWTLAEATVLHSPFQVWVDVDYRSYRRAYCRAFPNEDIRGLVLDHVLNRQVARAKRMHYVRIIPISRSANSSSGGLAEKWSIREYSLPDALDKSPSRLASVQYADLADIVKMLNRNTGGSIMQGVNDAQVLVDLPQQ